MKGVHAQRISGCRMAGVALWAIGMGGVRSARIADAS